MVPSSHRAAVGNMIAEIPTVVNPNPAKYESSVTLEALMSTADDDLEKLEKEVKCCGKCRLAQTRTNALSGEGNPRARLMLVAQAPGENEDREGRMFIGPSGQVLDRFLARGGIDRSEIYMTNLVKCALPRNRKPKHDEIESCAPYLEREIDIVKPQVIAPMGYYATRYTLDRYSVDAPEPRAEFAEVYGTLLVSNGLKLYPLPHPASVLFDSSRMEDTAAKYEKLEVFVAPCKWFPVCPLKSYWEKGLLGGEWVESYCRGDWRSCQRYHLEERGIPHPDWMLPDGTLDESLAG